MKDEEMDVFARAFLFLYSTALRDNGVEAELIVSRTTDKGGETNA